MQDGPLDLYEGQVLEIDGYFISAFEKITWQNILTWFAATVLVGGICVLLCKAGLMKKRTVALLVLLTLYITFVLTLTIVNRTPWRWSRSRMELFWTINAILEGRSYLISEIIWNIVLFVPIGVLASAILHRRPWWSLLFCTMLSGGIEVVQLLTHRGLFEFDDIIYNGFGAVIGLLLFLLLRRIRKNNGSTAEL